MTRVDRRAPPPTRSTPILADRSFRTSVNDSSLEPRESPRHGRRTARNGLEVVERRGERQVMGFNCDFGQDRNGLGADELAFGNRAKNGVRVARHPCETSAGKYVDHPGLGRRLAVRGCSIREEDTPFRPPSGCGARIEAGV